MTVRTLVSDVSAFVHAERRPTGRPKQQEKTKTPDPLSSTRLRDSYYLSVHAAIVADVIHVVVLRHPVNNDSWVSSSGIVGIVLRVRWGRVLFVVMITL